MTATPTPWIAYLAAAVERAGGVEALARRSHVSTSTLHRWLAGEITADRVTVGNVTAIAEAIGDDPANALRAAGNLASDPTQPPPAGPTLADELAAINRRIEQIIALRLPWAAEDEAIAAQHQDMNRAIRRYQDTAQGDEEEGGRRTA